MSSGLVLIDDIIYQVSALTNQTYPFSIINGDTIDDVRGFKNGNNNTVATEYNYSIRTNFVYAWSGDYYPNNISTSEVFFDPLTCQRAECVLDALSKKLGDISLSTSNTTIVNKDEQGNNIVGTLNYLNQNDNLKWKYFLYSIINQTGKIGLGYDMLESGSDSITLTSNNLPSHNHSLSPSNATTNTGGSHIHTFQNAFYSHNGYIDDNGLVKTYGDVMTPTKLGNVVGPTIGVDNTSFDFNNYPVAFEDATNAGSGAHNHGVTGFTENNTTTNTAIDIKGKIFGVKGFAFKGFPTVFTVSDISSPTGEKVVSYQWWKNGSIKYNNM